MDYTLSCRMRIVLSCCLLAGFTVLVAPAARGQESHLLSAPPPPMKFVSRSERTQLSVTRDAKARTRATIELAEARLSRAEQLTAGQQYDAANAELGVYQGLIEDALVFLGEIKKNDNKLRDTYKRLELALRVHCARLEAIRRVTPSDYAVHVKAICECARNARTAALNSFYGDTVVREEVSHGDGQSSGGDAVKDPSSSGSAKKQ